MKDFCEFLNENIDLSWKSIFGKEYTHEDTLKKRLIDGITHIVMEENGVSEKSFGKIDEIIAQVKEKVTNDILEEAEKHLQSGKRMNLFYEQLYDKIFA